MGFGIEILKAEVDEEIAPQMIYILPFDLQSISDIKLSYNQLDYNAAIRTNHAAMRSRPTKSALQGNGETQETPCLLEMPWLSALTPRF